MKNLKLLLYIGCYLFLFSCQKGASWEETLNTNTVEGYQAFLKNNPATVYKDTIPLLIAEAAWQVALTSQDIDSLKGFQAKYPDFVKKDTVETVILALEWDKLQKKNTLEAYEAYLESHKRNSYTSSVENKIEAIKWAKAKEGSKKDILDFFNKYDFSRYKDSLEFKVTLADLKGRTATFRFQSGEFQEELPVDESERVVTEDLIISFAKDGTFTGQLEGVQEETVTWSGEFKGKYSTEGFNDVEYRNLDFSDTEEEEIGEWVEAVLTIDPEMLIITGDGIFSAKEYLFLGIGYLAN